MKNMLNFLAVERVKNALLEVTKEVYHYEAGNKGERYIVYSEDAEASGLHGDNRKLSQAIQGTIDLFTKNENDEWAAGIQDTMQRNRIAFRLGTVEYEDETQYIHYQWIFEVS